MIDKFQNKYRISSSRLKNYNSNGSYFITICTDGRKHYFGKVINGKMKLSEIGELAYQFWEEIPSHFPNVQLDVFVIMRIIRMGLLSLIITGCKDVAVQHLYGYGNVGCVTDQE